MPPDEPPAAQVEDGRAAAIVFLLVATAAALAVVPDWPHRHLDDPSYWGVAGFLIAVLVLLRRSRGPWGGGSANRRVVRIFLVGVPLVYLADRIRFGGSTTELLVQLGGLGIWIGLAAAAARSDLALWLGCAGHGLWDAIHLGRVEFVPAWYAAACVAADLGVAAFVLLGLRREPDVQAIHAPATDPAGTDDTS